MVITWSAKVLRAKLQQGVLSRSEGTRMKQAHSSDEKTEGRIVAGQLALEVMHEIRNPLEALSHLIYLMREDAQNCENVLKYAA